MKQITEAKEVYIQLSFERFKVKLVFDFLKSDSIGYLINALTFSKFYNLF